MALMVGVPKETFPGERRVALIPASMPALAKAKIEALIEPGAGANAGFLDAEYTEKGAKIAASRAEVFAKADILLQVRGAGSEGTPPEDLAALRKGQMVIGFYDPLSNPAAARAVAERGATVFSMELIPRISRAQSMDALSSMATIAGYKAVLMAADTLPRMFPMLMTAAGTLSPARALVIGAGVAGLQAISTARRLGSVVHAYDVRPAVKEQILSLGAKFVELPLETANAEDKGGYAREQSEDFLRRQRELLGRVVAESDVVISTAAIPGKRAPVIVTADMVRGMRAGSVIVDLAAERGGNCELTRAGETVVERGVTILGPLNLPSTIPYHASQMYAKNVVTLLLHLAGKEARIDLDRDDEILRGTLLTRDGQIVHEQVKKLLG